jgi:hypothetical protein
MYRGGFALFPQGAVYGPLLSERPVERGGILFSPRSTEVVEIMMPLNPRSFALSQMVLQQTDDGLIDTHACTPGTLADRPIEIWWEVPERNSLHSPPFCIETCSIVMHGV